MGVRIEDNSEEFLKTLSRAVDKGLDGASLLLADRMADQMPGASARVVAKTRTGRNVYRAASPGDSPGVRTNRLRSSLTNAKLARHRFAAGTNVQYARFLERGTSRMKPRPFMRPALRESGDAMSREFTRIARREIGRTAGG